MWFDLINNAELSFLFWYGKGLGAVLLAFVLIAMTYLLRPVMAGKAFTSLLQQRISILHNINKPPPKEARRKTED